jgi:WD40 repeat protein
MIDLMFGTFQNAQTVWLCMISKRTTINFNLSRLWLHFHSLKSNVSFNIFTELIPCPWDILFHTSVVRLWDVSSLKEITMLSVSTGLVKSLVFDKSGTYLASGQFFVFVNINGVKEKMYFWEFCIYKFMKWLPIQKLRYWAVTLWIFLSQYVPSSFVVFMKFNFKSQLCQLSLIVFLVKKSNCINVQAKKRHCILNPSPLKQ